MNEPRFRHEIKYLVSEAQIQILRNRISVMMKMDPHIGPTGKYTIRSLYFDDYENRCFCENVNGTDPREKYRLRIYDQSAQRISLECKRKEHGMTSKTSCLLTKEQAETLIRNVPLHEIDSLPPLLRRLEIKRRTELLHPVVIVEYERIPYVYRSGNVRVTFDRCISSAADCNRFLDADIPKRPVMPPGLQLMEVKYDSFLPDAIYRCLNLDCLSQTAFSKYTICRKYML